MEETDSKNLTVYEIKSTDTMFIISKDAVFEATDELAKELLYDLFIFKKSGGNSRELVPEMKARK